MSKSNNNISEIVQKLKDIKGRILVLQQEENSLHHELLSEIDGMYMKMLTGQVVDTKQE